MSEELLNILIVDDIELDVEKIVRGFRKLNLTNPCIRASDGIEALDLLRGSNGAAKLQPPLVILLDLNMPRMNGIEFLKELRGDPALMHLPVLVLSTSEREADRETADKLGVQGYIVKPFTNITLFSALAAMGMSFSVTASAA